MHNRLDHVVQEVPDAHLPRLAVALDVQRVQEVEIHVLNLQLAQLFVQEPFHVVEGFQIQIFDDALQHAPEVDEIIHILVHVGLEPAYIGTRINAVGLIIELGVDIGRGVICAIGPALVGALDVGVILGILGVPVLLHDRLDRCLAGRHVKGSFLLYVT